MANYKQHAKSVCTERNFNGASDSTVHAIMPISEKLFHSEQLLYVAVSATKEGKKGGGGGQKVTRKKLREEKGDE